MTTDERAELRRIMREVAMRHCVDEADLYVRDKSDGISTVRHEAWARCRDAGYSFPTIAKLAGWDHSAVMHGVQMHRKAKPALTFKSRRAA